MAPLDADVSLTDKYRVSSGAALMTGMQALVRLLLEQADMDADRGWRTGGYVSGYRGSPIGTFDMELPRARKETEKRNIVFNPGLNEDLAATAISGTQMLGQYEKGEVEGVFAVADIAHGNGGRSPHEAIDQGLEARVVPMLGAGDQPDLFGGVQRVLATGGGGGHSPAGVRIHGDRYHPAVVTKLPLHREDRCKGPRRRGS